MEEDADKPRPLLEIDRSMLTPHLAVRSIVCRAHVSGCGAEEPVESPRIILPRRGVFIYHLHRTEHVADADTAFFLDPGDVCRVSHPVPGGDDCTVLVPDPGLLAEVFGGREWLGGPDAAPCFRLKRGRPAPGTHLGLWALQAALGDPEAPLLAAEIAMRLLGDLARLSSTEPSPSPQKRFVERAQLLLASAPSERHTLETLGNAVHCSPFHLARAFRKSTGLSLHQYLTVQRMNQALRCLSEGEEDLSRLALDLGFASHSHFSERFRKVFALPPQEARMLLTRTRLAEMRRILAAPPRFSGLSS